MVIPLRERVPGLTRICALVFVGFFLSSHMSLARPAGPPWVLAVRAEGSGTVARNPEFGAYPNGSVVTVTANPADGWMFSHWTGSITGTVNPQNVEMTEPKSVTAHFVVIPEYTLSVSTAGSGTVSLEPAGGTYRSNTVVNVRALPQAGWVFVGWEGAVTASDNPLGYRLFANSSLVAKFVEKAAIENPPINQLVPRGTDVTFTVAGRGEAPLSYRWFFGEQLLQEETSASLRIEDAGLEDEGTYRVEVSNAYGSASASAVLAIEGGCTGANVVREPTEEALRAAIATGGYVRLCFNGTVILSQEIRVNGSVVLDASDREVIISGNGFDRLFSVASGASLAATNIVFANGLARGESITNGAETLGLTGEGGGFYNRGDLRLTECVLRNNRAVGGSPGGSAQAGAILNAGGMVHLLNCELATNSAVSLAGSMFGGIAGGNSRGGAIASFGGEVVLNGCLFEQNIAEAKYGPNQPPTAKGGAMFAEGTTLTISESTFSLNTARGENGAFFEMGGKGTYSYGGAIYTSGGKATLGRSRLEGNSALGNYGFRSTVIVGEAHGGALYLGGETTISLCHLSGNRAESGFGGWITADATGGAIYHTGQGTILATTIDGNFARGGGRGADGSPAPPWNGSHAFGGGIANAGTLTMTNCTLALNRAEGGNGSVAGSAGSGVGGALYNFGTASFLGVNLTIASNSVRVGHHFYEPQNPGPGAQGLGANAANTNSATLALKNSLLAYPQAFAPLTAANVHGSLVDGGHNMSSDGSANFSSGTSFNFTDPKLVALAENGGETPTMALTEGSPAIDFANANAAPAVDQRGVTRPFGSGPDIGAFEYTVSPFSYIGSIGYFVFRGQACPGYHLVRQNTGRFLISRNPPRDCPQVIPPPNAEYVFALGHLLPGTRVTVEIEDVLGGGTGFLGINYTFTVPNMTEPTLSGVAREERRTSFLVKGHPRVTYVVEQSSDFNSWQTVKELKGGGQFESPVSADSSGFFRVLVESPAVRILP